MPLLGCVELLLLFSCLFACREHPHRTVYILFDSVDGLTKASEIKLHGLVIGNITQLSLDGNRVCVTAVLTDTASIPQTSLLIIESQGLLGPNYIAVYPDTSSNTTLVSGDTLHGTTASSLFTKPATLTLDSETVEKLKPLADTLAHAIRELHRSLQTNPK